MYSFKDTTINLNSSKRFLPTSAMMYDGMYLEDLIEGYQTLTVEGREMLSVEVEQQDIQIGSIITNQKIPPRTELLNYLYRNEDVEIRFHDELDFYYYGRYTSTDTVPGDSNSIISSFNVFCADPLKYTKECVSDGYIGNPIQFPITPRKIEVTLSMNNSIKITNGEQNITITDAAIKTGDVLIFDFSDEQVTVNGEDCTSIIDLESDFENFYLKQGQKITSNNGNLKIFYRGATI